MLKKISGLEFYETGMGDPVIFLHGVGNTYKSFHYQFGNIPGRLLGINLPGYGNSDKIKNYNFETICEVIKSFTDSLGLRDFCIIGHSLGGMLAIDFACRNKQLIKKLCLIGTTPFFGGGSGKFEKEFFKARLEPLRKGGTMRDIAKVSAKKLVSPNTCDELLQKIESQISSIKPEVWISSLRSLEGFNREAYLGLIDTPCLLIAGEYDQNAPVNTMKKMHESLPNSNFYEIKKVGHMIHMEAPKKVNKLVADFLWSTNG